MARAEHLVPAWLPGGVQRGHEYVCGGMSGGAGSSCSVNLNTGAWADFATGEQGGDLTSLYAAIYGLPMGKAAVQVARDEGLEDVAGVQHAAPGNGNTPAPAPRPPSPPVASKPPRSDEGWTTVTPVPANAPDATFKHHARRIEDIEHKAAYIIDDELYGYVIRFRTSDGGKETLPYTWCLSSKDGACKWTWKTWDEPRPLYYPGGKSPAPKATVILVEGEKKAAVLQALLDAVAPGIYVVASWVGGCKAWKKAAWPWLAGRTIVLWPDCDGKRVPLTAKERNACADSTAVAAANAAQPLLPTSKQPGMSAMLGIGALLQTLHCTVQMLPIPEPLTVPDGWDCADAINTDGWDGERVLAFFGKAFALPAEGAAAALSVATDEKKSRTPGGANASDKAGAEPETKPLPWWLACFHDPVKNRWNLSRETVIMAFQHDEHLRGVLGFNELSNSVEARKPWPFAHGRAGKITGATDLLLGHWLSAIYGIPALSRQALMEGIETVAYEQPFHPVREWLQSLQWDGEERISKWLIHVIRETPEKLNPRQAEYLALVGRFWLLGMVARVMKPGCKFDYMPVLEGPGGLGKSTLVETLVSTAWYSDTKFDLSKGKESQEQVAGVWGYEVGELSAMAKAEVTDMKAFVTSKVDRYRPAYGRVVEEHPRQCVLIGTTNESAYLRDRTGNRRFWPIPLRFMARIGWLGRFREQLFAEAYALYLAGEAYAPSREQEERLFAPEQDMRLVETAVTSELLLALTRDPGKGNNSETVNNLTKFVTLGDLLKCLMVDAGKSNAGLEGQIRTWMHQQGWEYKKKQIGGTRMPGWHRPDNWPAEEAESEPAAMPPMQAPDDQSQPGPAPDYDPYQDDAPF